MFTWAKFRWDELKLPHLGEIRETISRISPDEIVSLEWGKEIPSFRLM